MPSPTAASWVKFFTNADIPSSAAATYAHVFVENRIQLDMLMDLNKEYLREMGITTMGDIIAILRHAKRVAEQSAREKVLSVPENEPGVPVATVSGTPNTGTGSNVRKPEKPATTARAVSSIGPVSSEPKPRRVLPEHEGKYKITLPTGSTARSRQILEKKEAKTTPVVDEKPPARVGVKRSSIFDRLSSDNEPPAKFSSPTPKVEQTVSCSIFARLGGRKVDNGKDDLVASSAGILKKSSAKLPSTTVDHKYKPSEQKVILVKKIPAKAVAVSSDEEDLDYYPKMSGYGVDVSGGLKSVSFSEEDEVLEIAPRTVRIQGDKAPAGVRPRFSEEPVSVKQRLGGGATGKAAVATVNRVSSLHGTKKVVQMKHTTSPRAARRPSPARVSLKSDAMMQARKQPIKNRLSLGSQGDTKSLSKRVERFSLDSKLAKVGKVVGKSNGSVFDRLGYNRK
ncbi:AGAP007811-PA-like protein [Anopheles sinensis]|uniref:AGAP007811-PA-like protein n=1 Tax=Anopheles sinensis TaxID=74873 RepID=A0A084VDS6_ANOSI|nr:AGAP007811-PA-like protein [Anopheles sinensis]